MIRRLRAKTLEEFDKIDADLDFYSWCFEMNPCVQGLCQFANLNNMRTLFIAGWLHLFELFWIYYLQNGKRYTGNHLDIWTHLDICDSVEPLFQISYFQHSDIHVFERIILHDDSLCVPVVFFKIDPLSTKSVRFPFVES